MPNPKLLCPLVLRNRGPLRVSMFALAALAAAVVACSSFNHHGAATTSARVAEPFGDPDSSAAAGVDEYDWARQVERQIAGREYRASQNHAGLQAPNRVHNLRTYFDSDGIRLVDRTADVPLMGLRLQTVGREAALVPVGPGTVRIDGARVEIDRPGVVEWYHNTPQGLEQGFTIATPPSGSGPLLVELAVDGAAASLSIDRVMFRTQTGRELSYGHLVVTDSKGVEVASQFAVSDPDRLQLVVYDRDALYPLIIDPLITGVSFARIESDQADTRLGWSASDAVFRRAAPTAVSA